AVIFTVDGRRSTYRVTGNEVVTPDAMRIVEQTPAPTATLFACHPPGSAQYRYVVKLALEP
ncbi:MAG: sortase domain-containing protein, partial [Acidimicrobiales bacterium]